MEMNETLRLALAATAQHTLGNTTDERRVKVETQTLLDDVIEAYVAGQFDKAGSSSGFWEAVHSYSNRIASFRLGNDLWFQANPYGMDSGKKPCLTVRQMEYLQRWYVVLTVKAARHLFECYPTRDAVAKQLNMTKAFDPAYHSQAQTIESAAQTLRLRRQAVDDSYEISRLGLGRFDRPRSRNVGCILALVVIGLLLIELLLQ